MSEDDLEVAGTPSGNVKAAVVCTIMGGLFLLLTGVQLLGMVFRADWMNIPKYAFLGVGALLVGLSVRMFRGRVMAAVGASVLTPVACLAAALWFIVTFGSVMSLMNVLAVVMLGVATLLQWLALSDVRRMSAARQRLADDGLSLGL